MSEPDRLSPLPPPLRAEAERLRSLQPPPDFQARLHTSLLEADHAAGREPAVSADKQPVRHWPWSDWSHSWMKLAALAVPMMATAVLVVHAITDSEGEPQQFTRTIHVTLDDDGHSWVDLGLVSHHHNGSEATVHVEAPSEVSVLPTGHATVGDASPSCVGAQCMYRFTQPTPHPDRVPVQIGIRAPGEYKIRVKHVSQSAHVQEEVLVRASNVEAPDSGN